MRDPDGGEGQRGCQALRTVTAMLGRQGIMEIETHDWPHGTQCVACAGDALLRNGPLEGNEGESCLSDRMGRTTPRPAGLHALAPCAFSSRAFSSSAERSLIHTGSSPSHGGARMASGAVGVPVGSPAGHRVSSVDAPEASSRAKLHRATNAAPHRSSESRPGARISSHRLRGRSGSSSLKAQL